MHFKEKLRMAPEPAFGALGETLYAYYVRDRNITWAHHNNTDIIVDGVPIDVKSTRKGTFTRVSGEKRMVGIQYVYVTFDVYNPQSPIKIYDDTRQLLAEYTVSEVENIVGTNFTISTTHTVKHNRKQYWKGIFPSTYKIVYRSGATSTQRSMGTQGWGPEAFYERSHKYTHVVCIYEQNDTFHHAEACRMYLQHEIDFYPVHTVFKGKPTHTMTYNPTQLDTKFIFTNEDTLVDDINNRFTPTL